MHINGISLAFDGFYDITDRMIQKPVRVRLAVQPPGFANGLNCI